MASEPPRLVVESDWDSSHRFDPLERNAPPEDDFPHDHDLIHE